MNIAMTERSSDRHADPEGQGLADHRLDERHRPRHRAGARRRWFRRDPERFRQAWRRSRRSRRRSERISACASSYSPRDMSDPLRSRSMIEDGARRTFGASTSSSTMPASSTSRPCRTFAVAKWDAILAINLSLRLPHDAARPPLDARRKWGRIINIASAHALVGSAYQVGLRRRQARHARADQGHGARDGGSQASPATPFAPATSTPRSSRRRSKARPRRT